MPQLAILRFVPGYFRETNLGCLVANLLQFADLIENGEGRFGESGVIILLTNLLLQVVHGPAKLRG